MTKSDQIELIKALNDLRTVVKDTEKITAKRIAITATMLKAYPYPLVKAAIQSVAETSIFFPAPAEIIHRIRDDGAAPNDSWRNVLKAISRYGIYDQAGARKSLKENEWAAVDAIGGWRVVCGCQETEIPFLANQYKKAIAVYRARETMDRFLPSGQIVAGYLEAHREADE